MDRKVIRRVGKGVVKWIGRGIEIRDEEWKKSEENIGG